MLRILRKMHFLSLEHQLMKSKECTLRTTVHMALRMNIGRVVGDSRPIKTRNNPILKSKITVFTQIKVVK